MAWRSVTGFGSSRDGGSGIPGVPQPLSRVKPSEQKMMAEIVLAIRRKKSVSEAGERQSTRGDCFSL
jgi:hypothetical protein